MATIKHKLLVVGFFLTCLASVFGEVDRKDITLASRILKGLDDRNTKEWAINVLRQAAEIDSNAYAMNALGIAYFNGIGLEVDTLQAVKLLERAGALGYRKAFYNLGLAYKEGRYHLAQDFSKAYAYFERGSALNSAMCLYGQGYLLYKGFGCKQDYAKAVELFQRGADKDYNPCMYMLGLCYRNGYGIGQDLEKASFYLKRAATQNSGMAQDELNREFAEIDGSNRMQAKESHSFPEVMPEISPIIMDLSDLNGIYEGVIVTYDWSGQHAIDERMIKMETNSSGNSLVGYWYDDGDTIKIKASITDDGKLIFSKGTINLSDRYTNGEKFPFRFQSADICFEDQTITGRLRLYSIKQKEPDRPMYLMLQKQIPNEDMINKEGMSKRIYAYPYPFTNQLTVHFDLEKPTSDATLAFYNQYGVNIKNYPLGKLSEGSHNVDISPNISGGVYVLRLITKQEQFKNIIVRKRGF